MFYKKKNAVQLTSHTILLELTLLSIIALKALRVKVPVAFRRRQKPGRHYASRELSEWTTQLFGATKILSKQELTFLSAVVFKATKIPTSLRADVPVAFRDADTQKTLCFPLTIRVENVAFRGTLNLEDAILPLNCRSCRPQLLELPKFYKLKS